MCGGKRLGHIEPCERVGSRAGRKYEYIRSPNFLIFKKALKYVGSTIR